MDFIVHSDLVIILLFVNGFDLFQVASHLEDIQNGAGGDRQVLIDFFIVEYPIAFNFDTPNGRFLLYMKGDDFSFGAGLRLDPEVVKIPHVENGFEVCGELAVFVYLASFNIYFSLDGIRFDTLVAFDTDLIDDFVLKQLQANLVGE